MSFKPTKVMDLELSAPLPDYEGLHEYGALKLLVRLHGYPVGYVELPVRDGRCSKAELNEFIQSQFNEAIISHLVQDGLAVSPESPGRQLSELLRAPHPLYDGSFPLITVAVCSRDRASDLARCLDALREVDYPAFEILVVDNAPSDDATEQLIRRHFPGIRYVREQRPGLDWARNRAIGEARGEIIAFTDDDVIVDAGWLRAIAPIFAENPEVMAVTGLVVAYELETEAQLLFERYGGFGRGFERKWYHLPRERSRHDRYYIGSGALGTGANMAFRRSLFGKIGLFNPALDVGTVTNGGGDLEMFFRVLKLGYTLVYEPAALVRHRHRRDYSALRTQLTNNGIGFFSYLTSSAMAFPDEASSIFQLGLWWLWWWNIRRLLISFRSPSRFPRDLILAELRGSLSGLVRYPAAKREMARIARTFGTISLPENAPSLHRVLPTARKPVAVRMIDLNGPVVPLDNMCEYDNVRLFVRWTHHLLGAVDIPHIGQHVSAERLRQLIAGRFGLRLSRPGSRAAIDRTATNPLQTLIMGCAPEAALPESEQLARDIPVSVIVATRDRPDDLRNCLRGLVSQATNRPVEIIVVDNNPTSGKTAPVVAEFPGVVLLNELRKGLSYARNAGISASVGDVVLTTDDDVIVPADWLEKLVAPFSRADVVAVTGNVLPFEIETEAQHAFELYGGLGRGFERKEYTAEWFAHYRRRAVPTWQIGATANAAFRAAIFSHPAIGLLDEALGAGTPTGCSEDTDLFYKVLKAGYTIVYEPSAYLWHKHRLDMRGLRKQIFNYSKGHVAYHLTILFRDRDLRSLYRLLVELPRAHAWRIKRRLRGRSSYPLRLIFLEILGNLVGPLALWRSRGMSRRVGRSAFYIPTARRAPLASRGQAVIHQNSIQ